MYLKKIAINNYRSIQFAEIDFEKGLNILIGKNGVGKSNILKYINQYVYFFLFTGRSRALRNTNVEFNYDISYEEGNDNIDINIAFKNDKSINNNEVEYVNEITLSKKINGEYLFSDRTIKIKFDNSPRKKNTELDEFLKEIDFLRFFRRAYVTFEMSSDLKWLSSPNKYEIDSEFYPNSEGYFDTLRIIQLFEDIIESQFLLNENVKFSDIVLDDIKNLFFKTLEKFKIDYDIDNYLSKLTPISEIRINPNINIYFADNKILVENLLIDFN